VAVAGQYSVDLGTNPDPECEEQIGWGLDAMVEQDGCSVTTSVAVDGNLVTLPGELEPRGAGAWGYSGTISSGGYAVTFDLEFSDCGTGACSYATSTIASGPLSCHYEGAWE